MSEVITMKILKPTRRNLGPEKPDVGALRGRVGMQIIQTIRNTPPSDLTLLHRESEAFKKGVMAAIKDGTY